MHLSRCLAAIEAGKIAAAEELGRQLQAGEISGDVHQRAAYDIERSFAAMKHAIMEPTANLKLRQGEQRMDQASVVRRLEMMKKEDRLKVFRNFCRHCGTSHIPCSCGSDG